ncbi:MAG TPA: phenylalanine--tRNA ligase subunit alpha [Planctomycetes bacterium]|nr:phenylalanine--tRNA ligase subunit alpha [Planctomycetota bacterium]HIL53132.1 phenylalanine--tRNA ligase subunit alpha [Planctomycetota bacterium]
MENRLKELRQSALKRVEAAASEEDLRAVTREFIGKQGAVSELLALIPNLPPAERGAMGKGANLLKRSIGDAISERKLALEALALDAQRAGGDFDPSLPGAPQMRGSLHPLTLVRREVEGIFSSMGYSILDGPEVELDYYNFQALNIPEHHPAREMQDTFYCDSGGKLVMRTQTSPVQIRAMESLSPPFRVIAPGRVFRNEEADATHEHTFHQVEGLVVGRDITVGHLTGVLKGFLRQLFQRDLDVRLRPGYFPFVEPGFELDIRCPFCEEGCRVCKKTCWVEFCGCGLVHPTVLEAGGIDPEAWTGFAFGFGLDRLVMLRHGIDDIRHFMGGDLRFLEQF